MEMAFSVSDSATKERPSSDSPTIVMSATSSAEPFCWKRRRERLANRISFFILGSLLRENRAIQNDRAGIRTFVVNGHRRDGTRARARISILLREEQRQFQRTVLR